MTEKVAIIKGAKKKDLWRPPTLPESSVGEESLGDGAEAVGVEPPVGAVGVPGQLSQPERSTLYETCVSLKGHRSRQQIVGKHLSILIHPSVVSDLVDYENMWVGASSHISLK